MNKVLHFWIGHFENEDLYYEYLKEDFELDEDTPISMFCKDQKQRFIDHDCMEHGYNVTSDRIEDVFTGASYIDSFRKLVNDKFYNIKLNKLINVFIIVYGNDSVDKPRSAKGKGYWLEYLGAFPYSAI